MSGNVKKITIIAIAIIMIAAIVQICTKKPVQQNVLFKDVKDVTKGTTSPHESSTSWSLFEWMFGSSDKKQSEQNEETVEESKEGPLRSELNILSERLENQEKLPEFIWYPTSANKEDIEQHTALLRELVMLSTIVRNGTASSEQRDRYYEIKLKIVQEKLEQIKEYRERYKEFSDPEDKSDETIKLLEKEIVQIKKEMKKR